MLNKVITILFFSTILIGNVGFCAETNPTATTTNTSYDYNFNENSFNIKEINVFDSPDGAVVTVTADGGENKEETVNKARENLGIKLYFS